MRAEFLGAAMIQKSARTQAYRPGQSGESVRHTHLTSDPLIAKCLGPPFSLLFVSTIERRQALEHTIHLHPHSKRLCSLKATHTPWTSVTLYGVNHSPWVQGIKMALAEHTIPTRLISYPLGLKWFHRRGLIFPALKLADGRTLEDSFAMYQMLESEGYDMGLAALAEGELEAFQLELEQLFMLYALGRAVKGKRWRFIQGWSSMQEEPVKASGIVSRALITLYFWLLIIAGIRIEERKGRPVYDLSLIEQGLRRLNGRLEGKEWLHGDKPGCLDFALMGHIQCMMSGLTDELIPLVNAQEALMAWVRRMLDHVEGFTPLYARRLIDEEAQIKVATHSERMLFWLSLSLWLIAWPLSLSILVLSLMKRTKNPAHSGAISRRHRRAQGGRGGESDAD